MLIAFDAKRAVQNNTGLGNYSRYVVDILCRYYPDGQYRLFAPRQKENPQLRDILDRNGERVDMVYPSGVWRRFPSLWRTFGIPFELEARGIRIFHGLSNELPLDIRKAKGVKSVVTLHDLIFRRMPECYHAADRMIYDYKYRRSCELADVVVAVSECTKRDAMELWGIPEEKIKVVYQGCDESFKRDCTAAKKREVSERYHLPAHYILSVGSIERRKNALAVVKAFRLLQAEAARRALPLPPDLAVVLVGRQTPYTDEIRAYIRKEGLDGRVHILSGVTFPDLPAVYRLADVFVYPSRYEGFGIPILEALNSSVPVVAATGSCLEEAGGPDSLYVAPDDISALATALLDVLTVPQLRTSMVEKGKLYAARFSEHSQADRLMEIYRGLSGE